MSSRALITVALAAAFGCADLERGPAAVEPDAGPAADGAAETSSDVAALSFASSVRPLLEACVRCHAAGQEAGDTQLVFTGAAAADYAAVSRFVDTAAPSGSRLLAKMSGQGHEGGSIYAAGSPEYQTVLQWIQQGARP
jgi:hypothetical protein